MPITDPVLIFALAMLIFVSVPLVFERLRIPGVIGLILTGAVVGPNGIHLLDRGPTVILLGTVGLLYLMFMIGLELDLNELNRYRSRSFTFGVLSFLIPQLIGTAFAAFFGYGVFSSLLLGSVFASHTVLAYPVASRLGILKNPAVTATLGGTILTEILALLVLAVAAGGSRGTIGLGFWVTLLVSLAVYVIGIMWLVPLISGWFFRSVRSEATTEFAFVMGILFGISYLAHAAHLEPIVGALLVGLALNKLVPATSPLMNRIHFAGGAIFIPFFLLSVGMLVDVYTLSTPAAWIFAIALAAAATLGKLIAAKAMERIFRYSSDEGWVIFGLSVPHASGTLAIVLVGFADGLFDRTEVNSVVLTILVTCMIGPWAVERFGRRVALTEKDREYAPRSGPQRFLIPISKPGTADALVDLAILLRGSGATEPIYLLVVVKELAELTEARVAEAEQVLGHAVLHAAGAAVPVVPLTRVDQNIASGITRAMAETRTSTVVLGWEEGRAHNPASLVEGVLDQLLDQTHQATVVAKLEQPLNVTRRVVLLLPQLSHLQPGFAEALSIVKTLASGVGATLRVVLVGEEEHRYAQPLESAKPSLPTTFERLSAMDKLDNHLANGVSRDDLVILLGARRGTISWSPRWRHVREQLSRLNGVNKVILYPEAADTPSQEVAALVPPVASSPVGHGVIEVHAGGHQEALQLLVERAFPADARRVRRVLDTLEEAVRGFSAELRPGVVLPHARVTGIEQPILLIGTSGGGVEFPHASEPAHLILVLLSPLEKPELHLRALAHIARMAAVGGELDALLPPKGGSANG